MEPMSLQEISESATRALELAEQRLAEAAAELQRRSMVLQEVTAEKDAALAKVQQISPAVSGACLLTSWRCTNICTYSPGPGQDWPGSSVRATPTMGTLSIWGGWGVQLHHNCHMQVAELEGWTHNTVLKSSAGQSTGDKSAGIAGIIVGPIQLEMEQLRDQVSLLMCCSVC